MRLTEKEIRKILELGLWYMPDHTTMWGKTKNDKRNSQNSY